MKLFVTVMSLGLLVLAGCASAPAEKKAEPAAAAGKALYTFGFETGQVGEWHAKGPVQIEVTEAAAHTGKYSLFSTGRSDTWHAPEMDALPVVTEKGTYAVSAWVMTPKDGAEISAKLTMEVVANGSKNWVQLGMPATVPPGVWTKVEGKFRNQGVEKASLYIEALDKTIDFYADDVEISAIPEGK